MSVADRQKKRTASCNFDVVIRHNRGSFVEKCQREKNQIKRTNINELNYLVR